MSRWFVRCSSSTYATITALLIIVHAGFYGAVFAQHPAPVTIDWQASYSEFGGASGGYVAQTPSEAFVVAGSKYRSGFGIFDYWIISVTNQGSVLWHAQFGGSRLDTVRDLIVCQNGDSLLIGNSDSLTDGNKTTPNIGGADTWFVRVSSTGVKVWEHSVGSTLSEYEPTGCETTDGGFLIGAQDGDYSIWRCDSGGTVLWSRRFGGSGTDRIWAVKQTADGGFVLAGDSNSPVSGDKTAARIGGYDYWVVRLDASGSKMWDRTYGGNSNDVLQAVGLTSDGGFVLAGASASPATGAKTAVALGGSDWWIVRVDPNGFVLWDRTFGGSGDEGVSDLEMLAEDGVVISGLSNSETGFAKEGQNFGNHDGWLVRLDSAGRRLWDLSLGGNDYDSIKSVRQSADGGFIVGAESVSMASGNKTTPGTSVGEMWVIKLSAERPRLNLEQRETDLRLVLTGNANLRYRTEISSNLMDWTPILTNHVTEMNTEVLRLTNVVSAASFYRAVQLSP